MQDRAFPGKCATLGACPGGPGSTRACANNPCCRINEATASNPKPLALVARKSRRVKLSQSGARIVAHLNAKPQPRKARLLTYRCCDHQLFNTSIICRNRP